MTEQYTGRARITNKQTGASREGVVTGRAINRLGFIFLEDGATISVYHRYDEFTIEPLLPEIPSEPGDSFTAEVTRNGSTKRVVILPRSQGEFGLSDWVGGWAICTAEHIDRATIESVITAKERGL